MGQASPPMGPYGSTLKLKEKGTPSLQSFILYEVLKAIFPCFLKVLYDPTECGAEQG